MEAGSDDVSAILGAAVAEECRAGAGEDGSQLNRHSVNSPPEKRPATLQLRKMLSSGRLSFEIEEFNANYSEGNDSWRPSLGCGRHYL